MLPTIFTRPELLNLGGHLLQNRRSCKASFFGLARLDPALASYLSSTSQKSFLESWS